MLKNLSKGQMPTIRGVNVRDRWGEMSAVVRRVLPIIDASVPPSVDNYYHALPTPRRRHAHRGSAVLRILFVYAIFSDAYWQRLSDAFSHVRGADSRVAVVLTQACSGKGRVGA